MGQIRFPVTRRVRYMSTPKPNVNTTVSATVKIGKLDKTFAECSSAKTSEEITITSLRLPGVPQHLDDDASGEDLFGEPDEQACE